MTYLCLAIFKDYYMKVHIDNQYKKKQHNSASVYSKNLLLIYDLWVLGLSNKFIWKCPTKLLLDFYNEHITSLHLDVGVGTGYFLDKCTFPSNSPNIHLLDLNPNSLEAASNRISRYSPKTHQASILEPIALSLPTFDSIGINYLLHCLPNNMVNKEVVFKTLSPLLSKGGVIFGSTILGKSKQEGFLARKLMNFYNKKGIFSNKEDTLEELDKILSNNFNSYSIKSVGCVALFSAKI
jgi:ubiquinone/menaquinone biosynthesis C-methylase UbiE